MNHKELKEVEDIFVPPIFPGWVQANDIYDIMLACGRYYSQNLCVGVLKSWTYKKKKSC